MAFVVEDESARAEVATPAQIQAAVAVALGRLGLTYDDLAEQAEADDFVSERARRLWFIISPLDDHSC